MGRWLLKIALLSISFLSALFLPSTLDSADLSGIDSRAPVEIVADGFLEVRGVAVDLSGLIYVADRKVGTVTQIAQDQSKSIVAESLEARMQFMRCHLSGPPPGGEKVSILLSLGAVLGLGLRSVRLPGRN